MRSMISWVLFALTAHSFQAMAHGDGGYSEITGAECYVKGSKGRFDSILAQVSGEEARVYLFKGARSPIDIKQGLVASGKGDAYSMMGFPNNESQTVVIKVEESLAKFMDRPRIILNSKIINANADLPSTGYIANNMTEDDDIELVCTMHFSTLDHDPREMDFNHVQPANHPSICSIEFRNPPMVSDWTHGCTASVIGKNTALSAAHCQEYYSNKETRVRCGNDPQWRRITAWTSNPDYRPEIHPISNPHDISVLTLNSVGDAPALNVEKSTAKIQSLIGENRHCRHYGMGNRQDGSVGILYTSKYLQPHAVLGGAELVESIFAMTRMIASDPIYFVRAGDSGGPIICDDDRGQPVIVGVHSFISTPSSAAFSAMTSYSYDFIQKQTAQ